MMKTSRKVIYAGAAGVLMALGASFAYARRVDWPSRPDPVPPELVYALGGSRLQADAFYVYDLGGFVDHGWLWRIDANPGVIARLAADLKMHPTNTVPQRFWKMEPYYWPRSMPPGAKAFQSPLFSADGRGPDGPHYFMIYDKTQGRAFVLFKSNF